MMRRQDKEIIELSRIEEIIKQATICRLGLSQYDKPYIIPLCFGYSGSCLYFHSAKEGLKLDIIRNNPEVCFEIDIKAEFVTADLACNWGMKYLSVIGFGKAFFVNEPEEKQKALAIIMSQYSDKAAYEYAEKAFESIVIIKVIIESMTGKTSGY